MMRKKILGILILVLVFIVITFIDSDDSTTKVISYNGNNLRISIDGEISNTLPTSGTYYLVDYSCKNKNTKIIWNKSKHELAVSNGIKKGDVACYLEFKSKPLLSEMEPGSYIAYTGDSNNGCDDTNEVNGYTSCSGKNANYVSDTDMGYCNSSDYKFHVNGWRIGYIENSSAHLVSAGATDCMCTDSSGVSSSSSCSNSLSSTNIYKHFNNMDNIALKYCNVVYAKDGVCDNTTSWAMNAVDFSKVTGNTLSSNSCNGSSVTNRFACGYTNNLIDNGGYYWFATPYIASFDGTFHWVPYARYVYFTFSNYLYGVRPVLYLDSSVIVIGGSGTYDDPYQIANNSFEIVNGSNYLNSNDNLSAISLNMNKSSNVSDMCISVNTSVCTNYIDFSDTYTLDMSSYNEGEHIIYVYYKDVAGNIVTSIDKSLIIDITAPTNNSISISEGTGFNRTLTLSSTGASKMCFSNTSNNVSDCTNWVDYATTYSWSLTSGDGEKTVYAFFKDAAGNTSVVVYDSVLIEDSSSGITDYQYFMEVNNPNLIFLARSDGATAFVGVNNTSLISWNSVGSGSMNTCTIDSSTGSLTNYVWCIGNDNNVYYKPLNASSWAGISTGSYIDVSAYPYYISAFGSSNMYITRADGKTNMVTVSGLANPSWSFGAATNMLACTNINDSGAIACFGADGKYYFRSTFNSTTAYMGGIINAPISMADKVFIDAINNGSVSALFYYNNKIYNSTFSFSATTINWVESQSLGVGIKTCAASSATNYDVCLAEDNYLYYKERSAKAWTKGSLYVE